MKVLMPVVFCLFFSVKLEAVSNDTISNKEEKTFVVLESFFPRIEHHNVIIKNGVWLSRETPLPNSIKTFMASIFFWLPIATIFILSLYIFHHKDLGAPLFTLYLFLLSGVALLFCTGKYIGVNFSLYFAPLIATVVALGCKKIYKYQKGVFYKSIFLSSLFINFFVGIEAGLLSSLEKHKIVDWHPLYNYIYTLCAICLFFWILIPLFLKPKNA